MRRAVLYFMSLLLCASSYVGAQDQVGNSGVYWIIEGTTLKITGSGDMPDFREEPIPWDNRKSEITAIELGTEITDIGYFVFNNFSALEKITIPGNIKRIDDYAFRSCGNLNNITLSEGLESIGVAAFSGCNKVTTINIPASVNSIRHEAFSITDLTTINVDAGNETYSSHEGVLYTKDKSILLSYPKAKTDEAYSFHEDLVTLADTAFNVGNPYIKTVNLPKGVEKIGMGAFMYCSELTTISIPSTVTTIKDYAFGGCSKLTGLTVNWTDPNSVVLSGSSFGSDTKNITLYVPLGTVETYKDEGEPWTSFKDIQELKNTTGEVEWSYDETTRTLTIFGEGAMADYNYSDNTAPWKDKDISTVIIEDGVTHIGDYSFAYIQVNTLTIGSDVESIGTFAFANTSVPEIINMFAETPPTLGVGVFMVDVSTLSLYVPQGTKADYQKASGWSAFKNIRSIYTKINNLDDLKAFRDEVNGRVRHTGITVELKANIVIDEDWTPIGNDYDKPFKGTFNGNGYTISNLKISETNENVFRGLFGYVEEATLKGLVLKDVLIESNTFSNETYTGALIAYSKDATIENCHVISGTVNESEASGDYSFSDTGGLIGYLAGGEVNLCSNSAKVSSDAVSNNSRIGGLIGFINKGKVDRCFNQGEITGKGAVDAQYIGGLSGDATYTSIITNSYNVGNVTVNATTAVGAGGIVGSSSATIENCYSYADISGGASTSSKTGGLAGTASSSVIKNSLALSGSLEGNNNNTYSLIGGVGGFGTDSEGTYSWLKGKDDSYYSDPVRTGSLWGGSMSSEPISGWSATTWKIDATGALMPKLKGLLETIKQPDIKNPLKKDDTPHHTITLEVAPGINLNNLTAGNHQVEEGGHLHLQFLPEDHTLSAADLLLLIDGVETSFSDLGSGNYFSYILNPISQDHTILITLKEYTITLPEIDGATFTPGAGTHPVAYGQPFTFSLDLNDLNGLEDLKVLVNGIALTPDSQVGSVLTFTINSVTGPVEITVEGLNPTGNLDIANGKIRIATRNGQLTIDNSGTAVDVAVYTVAGQNVASLRALRGSETISLQPGIYLVKAGNEVYKVSVN